MIDLDKRTFLKTAGGAALGLPFAGAATAATEGDVRINSVTVPSETPAGENVRVTANVTNLNENESREADLDYRVNGTILRTVTQTLSPGETRDIDFGNPRIPARLPPGRHVQGVFFTGTNSGVTLTLQVTGAVFGASNFRAPGTAQVGEQVTATATITNRGNRSGTTRVRYQIGNSVVRSQTVTLDRGQSVELAFVGTVPQMTAGTKTQGIYFGDNSSPAASSSVVVRPTDARFQVNSISPSRTSGRLGQEVTMPAVVQNVGGTTGSTRFEFRIGNRRIDRTGRIRLSPGETRSIELQGDVPDLPAGDYRQGMFVGTSNVGLDAPFTVTSNQPSYSVQTAETPTRATAGQTVQARARVTNTGGASGTGTFQYRIDGTTVAERQVSLASGETRLITFEGTVPDRAAGRYDQGVFAASTGIGVTSQLRIDAPEAATFRIADLRAPTEAESRSSITVAATVRNIGSQTGTADVTYRLGGEELARQSVRLRGGNSTRVRFELSVPDLPRGNYQQGVFLGASTQGQTSNLRVRERPQFVFSGLNVAPSTTVGDRISVEVTVRNRGESAATRTVEYRIGENVIDSQELTLSAEQSRIVVFEGQVPELAPGTYIQGVYAEEERSTARLTVLARPEPGTARFGISNLSAPASGRAGAGITVTATVTNTGTAAGETTIEYRFDGETLASSTVDLAAGEATDLSFDATVPEGPAETYRHGVFVGDSDRGQTSSFVVEAEPTPTPTPTETATPPETATATATETASDDSPGFGPLVGLGGLAGVAYLRRKFGGSAGEDEEA